MGDLIFIAQRTKGSYLPYKVLTQMDGETEQEKYISSVHNEGSYE